MANANSSDILKAQVDVYRGLDQPRWLDGKVIGTLELLERLYPQIERLESRGDLTVINGELGLTNIVEIELAPIRSQQAFFARDLNALLQAHDFSLMPPADFYVAAFDYFSRDGAAAPERVRLYLETCRLAAILGRSADYIDKEAELNLIFLQKEKFELPVLYSEDDLTALDGLDDLDKALFEDLHRDQKRTIVAAVTIEMLRALPRAQRLPFLLRHFGDWLQRFKDSYRLYVSEFSFEKVKESIEAQRLEYTSRLNKVITDIQGQLLAIPVSLLVVATQMKRDGTALFNDTLIATGSLVFALLMSFLLRNQRHTLDVIYGEIQRQKITMDEKYAPIAESFANTFQLLARRYRHQKTILRTIDALVIISLLAPFAFISSATARS